MVDEKDTKKITILVRLRPRVLIPSQQRGGHKQMLPVHQRWSSQTARISKAELGGRTAGRRNQAASSGE